MTVLFLLAVLLFYGFGGGAVATSVPGNESLAVISVDLLDDTQADPDSFLPQPQLLAPESQPGTGFNLASANRPSLFSASYRSRAPPFDCVFGSNNTIG